MILSVSRRTDIPCHYAEWFRNRIRAGFCLTRNPMNPAQLYRVPLSPEVVDAIVFWTKDPEPLRPFLPELQQRGYPFYFQFTLTPYDHRLEPALREKSAIEATFRALSKEIGRDRIRWRYDPILLCREITVDFHKEHFRAMCQRLADATHEVTISFLDWYAHLRGTDLRAPSPEEQAELAACFGETAKECGLRITACCEKMDMTPYGIAPSACIDGQKMQEICGFPLRLPRDKNQRPGCGCCESVDIGVYNTCPNGCVYCYANHFPQRIRQNAAAHRPDSPILFGTVRPEESVREKVFRSHKEPQLSLY